jgi:hypothetical protein
MPVHEKLKNDLLSSTIIALYRGVLTLIALLKQLLRSWICKAVITSPDGPGVPQQLRSPDFFDTITVRNDDNVQEEEKDEEEEVQEKEEEQVPAQAPVAAAVQERIAGKKRKQQKERITGKKGEQPKSKGKESKAPAPRKSLRNNKTARQGT